MLVTPLFSVKHDPGATGSPSIGASSRVLWHILAYYSSQKRRSDKCCTQNDECEKVNRKPLANKNCHNHVGEIDGKNEENTRRPKKRAHISGQDFLASCLVCKAAHFGKWVRNETPHSRCFTGCYSLGTCLPAERHLCWMNGFLHSQTQQLVMDSAGFLQQKSSC